MNWKKLPIENSKLKQITVSGNGKDCVLTIEIDDAEETEISFEMYSPCVIVDIQGKVHTQSFSYGDNDLGVKYLPIETINIVEAEIDFPGDDEEWADSLQEYEYGNSEFIGYSIRDARIKLRSAQF